MECINIHSVQINEVTVKLVFIDIYFSNKIRLVLKFMPSLIWLL